MVGLFLVLFFCAAVAGLLLRYNSRLGPIKFPFSRLRELARTPLIWPAVFGAASALFGNKRKNSRFHGNNRVIAAAALLLAAVPAAAAYLMLPPPPLDRSRDASVLVLAADGSVLRGFLTADGKWRLPVEPEAVEPRYRRMLIAPEAG